MKIRNPFKGYLLRCKDDASTTEKIIWSMISVFFGMTTAYFLF
tara:strand:- start:37 stop:165 length:129 start_codon:yes stop_codon:yes gene_type:complete